MLKKSGFALLLLLAAFAVQAQEAPQTPTIRVSGEATSTVDADMAILSLGIIQQAKTALAAKDAVTVAADKVIESLVSLGIEKSKIRTSNFSVQPVYDERPGKQNNVVGYRGISSITVTLEDTATVAEAVEAAVGAGANEIRGLSYGKKDEEGLRIETLKKAVVNATDKAAAMAEALGRSLGAAILVEEQGFSMQTPDSRVFLAKAMDAASPEAFSPGSIDVSASVTVVFEME